MKIQLNMKETKNQGLTEETLIQIAHELEHTSGGRITLVTNQKNMSGAFDPQAGTFLKLDGVRASQDFSHYVNLSEFRNPEIAMIEFMKVLYSIRNKGFEDAYVNAITVMQSTGKQTFSAGRYLHFVQALA